MTPAMKKMQKERDSLIQIAGLASAGKLQAETAEEFYHFFILFEKIETELLRMAGVE